MIGLSLLLAWQAAVAPQPAPVSAAPQAVAPVSAHMQAAVELATLLNPEAQITGMLNSDAYGVALRTQMLSDPDIARLEERYPGVVAFTVRRMQPVMADALAKELPGLWQRLGAIYARRMTDAELKSALTFFRSPLGTKMRLVINANAAALTTKAVARGDKGGADNVMAIMGQAGVASFGAFTPAERKQIIAVVTSPLGEKLRAANTEGAGMMAAWSKEPHPAVEAAVGAVAAAAMNEFIKPGSTSS